MNCCYVHNKNKDFRKYGKGILFANGCALNEMATYIFERCDGNTTVESIIDAIFEEFDCTKDIITYDVNECIAYLLENDLIVLATE